MRRHGRLRRRQHPDRQVIGIETIEWIADRSRQENLHETKAVKHGRRNLDVDDTAKARIDPKSRFKRRRRHAACDCISLQAISLKKDRGLEMIDAVRVSRDFRVDVRPVETYSTMEPMTPGAVGSRAGKAARAASADRAAHPDRTAAE